MTNEPVNEPIETKTATDLRLEQLEQQMNEMKSGYEAQVKELSEANKDLWAALHPAQPRQDPAQQPDTKNLRPQADVLDEMIRKKLGIQ